MEADGGHTDGYSIKLSCISHILSAVCNQLWLIKISRNLCTALGISRQNHISAHFTFSYLNMILLIFCFGIIFHKPILLPFDTALLYILKDSLSMKTHKSPLKAGAFLSYFFRKLMVTLNRSPSMEISNFPF